MNTSVVKYNAFSSNNVKAFLKKVMSSSLRLGIVTLVLGSLFFGTQMYLDTQNVRKENEMLFAANKVLTNVANAQAKLLVETRAERDVLSSKNVKLQDRVDNALIAEGSFGEVFENRIGDPAADLYDDAKKGVISSYHSVKDWWASE